MAQITSFNSIVDLSIHSQDDPSTHTLRLSILLQIFQNLSPTTWSFYSFSVLSILLQIFKEKHRHKLVIDGGKALSILLQIFVHSERSGYVFDFFSFNSIVDLYGELFVDSSGELVVSFNSIVDLLFTDARINAELMKCFFQFYCRSLNLC